MPTDDQVAIEDLLALLAIPGPSCDEGAVADYLESALRGAGIEPGWITRDRAFDGSEYGGSCGNLIVQLPAIGDHPGPARLLTAHMDTVALATGCKPRLFESGDGGTRRIVNGNPATALGGDNRTGCAALLQVAREMMAQPDRLRPPIALMFCAQEEVGLVGSREFDVRSLGFDGPIVGFNFDGGRADELVTRVTGTSRLAITIQGKASHAGATPGDGVSAAVAMARALAALADDGWHGPIDKPQGRGSANVGSLHGGAGTNIVLDRLEVLAEARSHDPAFRQRILDVYRQAFQDAATRTTNQHGDAAAVTFKPLACYEAFALADDAPAVRAAVAACLANDIEPTLISNDGGMDANNLTAKGIDTVTLGLGQRQVHTQDEWIDVNEFLTACRIAITIAYVDGGGQI